MSQVGTSQPVPNRPPFPRVASAVEGSQAEAGRSPISLLLGWFVGPLALVLVIDRLGLPQAISHWVARLW